MLAECCCKIRSGRNRLPNLYYFGACVDLLLTVFQVIYPELLTIEAMAMDGVVLGHLCFLQNSVAVLLSITTISSLFNIPDMEDKGKAVAQGQPDLGKESKLLQFLVCVAPEYPVLSAMM